MLKVLLIPALDDSNIELINDHYKTIAKEDAEKYNFDFQNIISKDFKKRYSSIFNPITFIKSGFKKIINYKPLKKFLLLGYMAAAMFILFSVSRIAATFVVKDEDFIKYNEGKEVSELFEEPVEVDGVRYFEGLTPEYVKVWVPTEENLTNRIMKVEFFPYLY